MKTIQVHMKNKDNAAIHKCALLEIITIPFNEYLYGVVAQELGSCHFPEALKAQAIASASYASHALLDNAPISDSSKDSQAYNAAKGRDAAYKHVRGAVDAVMGILITFKGKPVVTHFGASNGGTIRASSNGWEPGGYADPWDTGAKRSGTGYGMSQNGAVNMAKDGKTYQEILAFYYPGTVLMGEYGKTTIKDSLTVETEGETMSETVVKNEESTSEETKSADTVVETEGTIVENSMQKVIAFAREQLGEPYDLGDHGPNRWDCSGLTMEAVKQIGLKWNHTSNGQYYDNIKAAGSFGAYGTLGTMPDKDCFLFHYGKRTNGQMGMVHVAIYDASKKSVIQAGGYCGKGVHENPFADCRKYFTHWATLKGDGSTVATDTQEAPATASVTRQTLYMLTSKDPAWMAAVRELQTLLNQKNEAGLKVDGKFGKITRKAVVRYQEMNGLKPDGIAGPITWTKLTA
jgi:cell wall-associated NlpC family hydrolase